MATTIPVPHQKFMEMLNKLYHDGNIEVKQQILSRFDGIDKWTTSFRKDKAGVETEMVEIKTGDLLYAKNLYDQIIQWWKVVSVMTTRYGLTSFLFDFHHFHLI